MEVTKETPKRFYNRGDDRTVQASNNDPPKIEQRKEQNRTVVYNEDRPLDVKRTSFAVEKSTAPQQPSTHNFKSPQELESYLKYLHEKQGEVEAKLWKLPSKAISKIDKKEKSELQRQLDEVQEEIKLVKDLVRR